MRLRMTAPRQPAAAAPSAAAPSGRAGRGLQRFLRDEEGAIAVTWAISLAMLFGFLALSIDLGAFYFDKRRQQSATDFAALAAAGNLAQAQAVATTSLASNGFTAADLQTVEPGLYVADPTLAPAARVNPHPTGPHDGTGT